MPLATSSSPNRGSKSGIITTETGERHIPSSIRADGSKRKEIKIRPGYKPPEDVEVYKNRTAEAWKTRGTGGVPGATFAQDEKDDIPAGSANNKNAKRREARKKAKATESAVAPTENDNSKSPPNVSATDLTSIQYLSLEHNPSPPSRAAETRSRSVAAQPNSSSIISFSTLASKPAQAPPSQPQSDPAAEQEKLVRNLKKKLRQARELREKKDSGESLLPEQFEKVIKINELIRQLDALGYDAEGEPKEKLIDV